jgi:hypothetical protein
MGAKRIACLLCGCLAASVSAAVAAPSCDRLIDGGVRDCNMRLSLDTNELLDQTAVTLTPEQLELARKQRPLRELAPTPEQYGQIQAYCRSHGEIRRRIGIQQGLCAEPPAE